MAGTTKIGIGTKKVIPDGKVGGNYLELKPNRKQAMAAARKTAGVTGKRTIAVVWEWVDTKSGGGYRYRAVGVYRATGEFNPLKGSFSTLREAGQWA